ncbi:MAG: CHAT domain-containing protein [Planctomycetes bacterium]|nr:CHAT domain-containing protein [Planctomycetota bacterium]
MASLPALKALPILIFIFAQDTRPASKSATRPASDPALAAEAKKQVEQGDSLAKENKTDDAISKYNKAAEIYDRARDEIAAAEVFAKIGDAFQTAHRIPEAVAGFNENLRRLRAVLDNEFDERVMYAVGSMGECFEEIGEISRALPMREQQLAIDRKLHKGDSTAVANSLNYVAYCLFLLGRVADALPLQEEALMIRKRIYKGDHPAVAISIYNVADCQNALGRSSLALPMHEEALAMRKRIYKGDHPDVARSLNSVGSCLVMLGRGADALSVHEEALAMTKRVYKNDHPDAATSLNQLGFCFNSLGRDADALPVHEEALAMWKRIYKGDHPSVATALNNVAYCLQSLGRYADALPKYEEALAMRKSVYKKDHPDVAAGLDNVAACLDSLHRGPDGLLYHREGVAMWRRIYKGDHPSVAVSLINGATCLKNLGHAEDALPMFVEALAMTKRIYNGDHPNVARGLNSVGTCLQSLGRSADALPNYEQALAMSRRIGDVGAHMWAANLAKLMCDDLKRPADAILLFKEAIVQIEEMRSLTTGLSEQDRAVYFQKLNKFGAYDGIVNAQLQLSQTSEALRFNERRCARSMLDLLCRSAVDPLAEARKHAEEAGDQVKVREIAEIEELLNITENKLSQLSRADDLLRKRTDLNEKQMKEEIADLSESLAHERDEQQEALRRRTQIIKENVKLGSPADPAEIQATLLVGERMLVYSMNDSNSYVFVVPPAGEEIKFYRLQWSDGGAVKDGDVQSCIAAYLDSIDMQHGPARGSDAAPAEPIVQNAARAIPAKAADRGNELFHALVPANIWNELIRCSKVYIVPHGALHRLPFETLIINAGNRLADSKFWLDAGPPIAYEPSGSVLKLCREHRDRQKHSSTQLDVAALGGAIFSRTTITSRPASAVPTPGPANAAIRRGDGDRRYGLLPPLPGTTVEVEAIEAAVLNNKKAGAASTVRTLLGENATRAKLFEAAAQARILHLATHHIAYETDSASYSALALTAPRGDSSEDDGFLKLIDLLEHWRGRLANCELTVLSACSTQRGQLTKDEGMYAMPIGFLYAGCPAVIASLWPVEDKSTAELMGRFYGKLMKQQDAAAPGESKLSAFTEARREIRKLYPEPYFWAAFVYIGDPR